MTGISTCDFYIFWFVAVMISPIGRVQCTVKAQRSHNALRSDTMRSMGLVLPSVAKERDVMIVSNPKE